MAVELEGVFKLLDRASPTLRAIERRADAADRAVNKLGRSLDRVAAKDTVSKLEGVNKGLRDMEGNAGRVDRAMTRSGASTRKATSEMDRNSSTTRKLSGDMGRLETAMRKVVIITSGLGKILRPVMFLGIAAAIRPLIGAVMALGAGATALVQQLVGATGAIVPLIARMSDLAGLGAVAATAMLSLKVATLTTKFAFHGVTQAMNGNKKALQGLTPEARSFVNEMKKLQPVLNTLRSSAQKGIFPGITAGIRTARRNGAFQSANQIAGGVGSAVGGVANKAISRFTDPGVLRDLRTQFGTFDFVITKLGGAAINLADAFRNVLFAAQPLTRWVVNTVAGWAHYLDVQSQVGRDTGTLTSYFNRTRITVTKLGHTVRDFGMGFINIMRVARGESGNFGGSIERIAKSFRMWTENFSNQARVALWFQRAQGDAHRFGSILVNVWNILVGLGHASSTLGVSMTEGIDKATARWAAWVNSFGGQNQLSAWFNGMRTTLGQLWGLVSDLGGAFARMGANGGGANSLIQNIRGLLPDLERALVAINKNLGPGLFGSIQQLAHLISNLTVAGTSPLGMFLDSVNGILAGVNSILDRFRLVRVAVAGALLAIGGAMLLRKLAGIAGGVSWIERAWQGVTGSTVAATEAAATYRAVASGGVPMMGGLRPGFAAPAAGVVGATEGAAARTGRLAGLRGALSGSAGSLGLGIGLPIAAGVGASLLQSNGVLGSNRAGQVMNVASMAGTGAMIGSIVPGVGTLGGAGIGAGAGLLMNAAGGGGPSNTAKYLQRLQATAGRSGFNIAQPGGGAQSLAQANQYQHILDRSLTTLREQKALASKQFGGSSMGRALVGQFNQAIAANQKLRGENIARLGVERATLKAQERQTTELRTQARIRQSKSIAAGLLTSYGQAFNVFRKGGMTVEQATHATVRNMESRAKTLQPAGARVLFQGGTQWLAEMQKQHPGLKKEYAQWTQDMKETMRAMGIEVTTSGSKVLSTTTVQWQKIKSAMQTPLEQALQQMSPKFTQLQNQARAVLIGLGYTPAMAANVIRTMEAGGGGPTAASFAPRKGAVSRRALGGRIPGMGLQDTVPIAPGAMAAPGELIVNRHTERRANSLLSRMGASLGGLVAGESKKHSDDILPDAGARFARGGRLQKVIAEANRIDAMHIPYAWGGSHGTPSNPNGPWDCSSATSRVLQAAGYGNPTMVSGQFENWGLPGPGPIGIAANAGHVYMVINGKAWGTSRQNPGGGPGWINGYTWRSGFVQRHAPGAGGAGGAFAMNTASGPGGLPLMGALNYSAFGQGLSGMPLAADSRGGHIEAVGLQGVVNRNLLRAAKSPRMAHRMMGGRVPEWGGWHAGGLDRTFDRPTVIGVGEKGAERVQVTKSGSGGGVQVHMPVTIHAHHPGDVKREMEEAMYELARILDRSPAVGGA